MLSPRVLTLVGLFVMALALAGGNLWFAAARSTIPLALDTTVLRKETRHEKHPPKDDVCFLYTNSEGVLHVDQPVYDAVNEGDRLRKAAWSRQLMHDEQQISLAYSADLRGLLVVMPGILAAMVGLAGIAVGFATTSLHARQEQT